METTTRVGADLGYRMTFVTDATLTFPIPHRDLPETATSRRSSPTRAP